MNRLIERCAMLDIHKSQITACVRVTDDAGGRRSQQEPGAPPVERFSAPQQRQEIVERHSGQAAERELKEDDVARRRAEVAETRPARDPRVRSVASEREQQSERAQHQQRCRRATLRQLAEPHRNPRERHCAERAVVDDKLVHHLRLGARRDNAEVERKGRPELHEVQRGQ